MRVYLSNGEHFHALSLSFIATIARLKEVEVVKIEQDLGEIIMYPDENYNAWIYGRMTQEERRSFHKFLQEEWGKAQLSKLRELMEVRS